MSPFILLQYCLPHHLLSRLVGSVANSRIALVRNTMIRWFIRRYGVNMEEALLKQPGDFASFNDFFTRELEPGRRPVEGDDNTINCPADGVISAIGDIRDDTLIQAKGMNFSLTSLLGGDAASAAPFRNGRFCTVYLSPKDYHRVHMPAAGRLTGMSYVPGRLFSVNGATTDQVPGLFARNERAVCFFDTERGPMAVVLVGAMIVAAIDTVWNGQVAPSRRGQAHTSYQDRLIELARGAEMGRFRLGSTAIMLFGPDTMDWSDKAEAGSQVRMGQALGQYY